MSNDTTDSCSIDALGYPDGGIAATQTEVVELTVLDPSGVNTGVAYASLTQSEEDNVAADGGGVPATAISQVLLLTSTSSMVSIGGTVTLSQDPTTMEIDANFSVTMMDSSTRATSSLTGDATPGASCEVAVLAR